MESFNDKVKNENALAGSNAYLKMNRNERFGQALKYKNNEYLENTYILDQKQLMGNNSKWSNQSKTKITRRITRTRGK